MKIDIEGYEFRILKSVGLHSANISGMAIEFHDILNNYEKFRSCIKELLKDFYITHVHANNYSFFKEIDFPNTWEITLSIKAWYCQIRKGEKEIFLLKEWIFQIHWSATISVSPIANEGFAFWSIEVIVNPKGKCTINPKERNYD